MTDEQIERHEQADKRLHVPAIVHRSGGVSADILNICGICGAYITPSVVNPDLWLEVTDDQADAIRRAAKRKAR